MRLKALLCAAALAAGAATSMAQNVYSLNVVGYINLTLTNGYNFIANQLDADGTLTNNSLTNIFSTNMPNTTKVWSFVPASQGFVSASYTAGSGKWIGNVGAANAALSPGQGVCVQVPGTSGTSITLTLVGQVWQGTNTQAITPALNLVSSMAPISGGVQTVLGYTPTKLDKVQQFNPVTGLFATHSYTGTTWLGGGEPVPAVGEAFFLNSATTTNWTQKFTVGN
jgi:hypothetical protein